MNALDSILDRVAPREGAKVMLHDVVPRTRSEAAERLTRIKATRSRNLFREFFKNCWATLEPDTPLDMWWGLDALCDHVQWLFEEWAAKRADIAHVMQVQNMLFNIPPRCLKSLIISVASVAWAWLHWPHMTFITLSCNPRVAQDNAKMCLKLINSTWYREWFKPDWRVAGGENAAPSNFVLERQDKLHPDRWIPLGWRKSRGWFTKITGEGADCLMPDDPHDADEAQGKVKRDAVLNKWDKSIRNRLRDRRVSIRLGIMQRLHAGDWTGHILNKMRTPGTPQWCCVRIPLEYNPKKPTHTNMPVNDNNRYDRQGVAKWRDPRTAEGEIMDPVRFTPEVIASERTDMGPYGFAGQMNQDPAPPDGGMFKRHYWRWFSIAGHATHNHPRPENANALPTRVLEAHGRGQWPRFDFVTLSLDCTFGDTEKADNVGCLVIAGIKADRFVLYDGTDKMDINETIRVTRELVKLYKCTCVLVEKKANGQAVCDTLKSEIPGIILLEPEGGKDSRAFANVPMIAAGNVYLLEGMAWTHDVVDEHAAFPKGAKDDRVDALSQCLTYYRDPEVALALASCRW